MVQRHGGVGPIRLLRCCPCCHDGTRGCRQRFRARCNEKAWGDPIRARRTPRQRHFVQSKPRPSFDVRRERVSTWHAAEGELQRLRHEMVITHVERLAVGDCERRFDLVSTQKPSNALNEGRMHNGFRGQPQSQEQVVRRHLLRHIDDAAVRHPLLGVRIQREYAHFSVPTATTAARDRATPGRAVHVAQLCVRAASKQLGDRRGHTVRDDV
mmetsp:Transcript_36176/g.111469  ORF Transcript_36176/g.111469 Transcript_36176/m.111469 type:complete len:212 (+) Transcript_36176:1805-2440(+)